MANRYGPVGVFDSGLGGIGVLRQLTQLMPQEHFIYYGDSANAPYGGRSADEVLAFSLNCWSHLENLGCKALVVACNTATSAAIETLRKQYPHVPMIGIEPALKPAVLAKDQPKVLVMATEMTLCERKFHDLLESFQEEGEIYTLPAPGIVPLVEQGLVDGPEILDYLETIFAEFSNIHFDSVVLGCTHFPFVAKAIVRALGYEVAIFDGAYGTAKETKRRLEQMDLVNDCDEKGTVIIENSSNDPELLRLSHVLMEL